MLNETFSVIFKHRGSGLFHSWISGDFRKTSFMTKERHSFMIFFFFFLIDDRLCRKEALCKLLRPNITVYENPIKCLLWIFHFHAFGKKSESLSFQTHFWRDNSNSYILKNETFDLNCKHCEQDVTSNGQKKCQNRRKAEYCVSNNPTTTFVSIDIFFVFPRWAEKGQSHTVRKFHFLSKKSKIMLMLVTLITNDIKQLKM